MMIYTSYFGKVPELLRSGYKIGDFIGVSVHQCKFVNVVYEKKLSPKLTDLWLYKGGIIDWTEYCNKYYNKLYDLEWVFWRDFEKNFDEKILLCYEKNLKTCHRYLIGKFYKWWSGKNIFKEI